MTKLILNSWLVSPYSAKVRSYLRFKGIGFEDRPPSAIALRRRIQPAVGRAVMPTVVLPDGRWLSESAAIIQHLEEVHPAPPAQPPGPRQRLVSLLFELYADEWLPIAIMHSRWNLEASTGFAIAEFAANGLPWLPGFLGRALIRPIANKMAAYRPHLGITEATAPGIERATHELIARLEAHFSAHPYLLGSQPCVGDFSLYGPVWAHLWRDPGSRPWFDGAPSVVRWMERLTGGAVSSTPATEGGPDDIPTTLEPILSTIFGDTWRFLERLVEAIDAWCAQNPGATRVPRSLGRTAFSIGGVEGERTLITSSQWRLQRVLEHYLGLTPEQRAAVDRWLAGIEGGPRAFGLRVTHPFVFVDHRLQLA